MGQQLRSALPPPAGQAGRVQTFPCSPCLWQLPAPTAGLWRGYRGWGVAVVGGDRVLPCPVPHHPLASRAAAPRPGRLLHAETYTPKSPWVKLLGSSHQLLFPSVPKPSEELVENKEVSVQGTLSQSPPGWGHGALSSVPRQQRHLAPAGQRRPASPLITPHISASLGSLPDRTLLPGPKPVCSPVFQSCFGISWQKAAGDPNSKYSSKSIFMRQMQNLCPTFMFGKLVFLSENCKCNTQISFQ